MPYVQMRIMHDKDGWSGLDPHLYAYTCRRDIKHVHIVSTDSSYR